MRELSQLAPVGRYNPQVVVILFGHPVDAMQAVNDMAAIRSEARGEDQLGHADDPVRPTWNPGSIMFWC